MMMSKMQMELSSNSRSSMVVVLPWLLLAWAGCASSTPASPEEVASVERQLLSPFQTERAIVADEIEIEISANFDSDIARPATSAGLHEFDHGTEDGVVVHRWTSKGGLQAPLQFMVGKTRLVALQSATLRIRGTGSEYALEAAAIGTVSESSGGKMANWREIRIENGVFSRH